MKTLLLTIVLSLGLIGSAQAVVIGPAVAWAVTGGAVFLAGHNTANQAYDARHFKGVLVSNNDGTEGYQFEITQYELDKNPSAYVVIK